MQSVRECNESAILRTFLSGYMQTLPMALSGGNHTQKIALLS